jgi:hypothetical protein
MSSRLYPLCILVISSSKDRDRSGFILTTLTATSLKVDAVYFTPNVKATAKRRKPAIKPTHYCLYQSIIVN